MDMETIEFAQFKIAQGVDEKEFLKVSDCIMPDLQKQKGFLSRKLVKGSDGILADIVRWKTLADALALAENFAKIESCHNYLGMIDESSVKISHFEQIRSWENSMKTYDVQTVTLKVDFKKAFAFISDPRNLPRWTNFFKEADHSSATPLCRQSAW